MDQTIPVLINSGGGAIKAAGVDTQRKAIETSFARHGLTAKVEALEGGDIAAAVGRLKGPVAVGGGDGSISAAAGVLAGTDRALGVLPLGTLNHFARDLGVPTLDEAVDAIASGRTRQVDVGEVNGRVFINNSSIGFYPRLVAERTREQRARGLPKWPAMAVAAVKTLGRFPRHRLSIRIHGREAPCVTPCVFVGNNRYSLAGLDVGKRERLDDGTLSAVVVHGQTLWSLAALSLGAALGRIGDSDDLDVFDDIQGLKIGSRGRTIEVSADGEVCTMTPPLDYRIRPAALRVFAPALGSPA